MYPYTVPVPYGIIYTIEPLVVAFAKEGAMGMYNALMKEVHDRAKKLEESGQLDQLFKEQQAATRQTQSDRVAQKQLSEKKDR